MEQWSTIFKMGADYRFVPLADHIEPAPVQLPPFDRSQSAKPDGLPYLSHQRPIPGGLSGRLTFEFEATSPVLFGMSGGVRRGVQLTVPARLSDAVDAPYIIPGRAVRAMLRSVYRIATFSELKPVNSKHRFGDRSPEYLKSLNVMGERTKEGGNKPERGWLTFVCRDEAAGLAGFEWVIRKSGPTPKARSILTIGELNQLGYEFSPRGDDYRSKARAIGRAGNKGLLDGATLALHRSYLVISGKMGNKNGEAIFGYPGDDSATGAPDEGQVFRVQPASIADFLLINSQYSRQGGEFPVGGRRALKENLRIALVEYASGVTGGSHLISLLGVRDAERNPVRNDDPPGIPVYFYPPEVFPHRGIVFGLSELFKIPHANSVGDILRRKPTWREGRNSSQLDWTEALFGKVDASFDDDEEAAGGQAAEIRRDARNVNIGSRLAVGFAHLFAGGPNFWGERSNKAFRVTQGAPKASFEAFYLMKKETLGNDVATWDSDNAVLAGHKRYPAVFDWRRRLAWTYEAPREAGAPLNEPPIEATDHGPNLDPVEGFVQPLAVGSRFEVHIDFRNLHPLELGALLWSVSFGDRAVFTEVGDTSFRHVGGRMRSKGMGRLKPRRARMVNLRQNPMPKMLTLDALGGSEAWPDFLMAAFEMEMGVRLAGGQTDDPQKAFYDSEPVTVLLNLSSMAWDAGNAGLAAIGPLHLYPETWNRAEKKWQADFGPFQELRRALLLRRGVYKRTGFKTVLGEFLKPPVNSPVSAAPAREFDTPNAFDALFDPVGTLCRWRESRKMPS